MKLCIAFAAALVASFPSFAAHAAGPRETLTKAVFGTTAKEVALAQINAAEQSANVILARTPGNRDAAIVRAMAIGYRSKLTKSRTEILASRKLFEELAKSDPRDPEAQAAVGGWHIGAIDGAGSFLARTVLGANKATGLAALDRAVALGGNRALFLGLSALLRLQLSGTDPVARALAEAAVRGTAPTPLDAQMQRSAAAVLVPLGAGDPKAARVLAKRLLPLGRVVL